MSAFEERQIATLVHGRYLLARGSDTGAGRPLLVGFHGYGENAETHLRELKRIPGAEDWVICAVGALHRFYNRDGEVIGSWMTRQQREQAIEDNVRYAAGVIAAVRREEQTSDVLVMAGFSQGVAMAYRAALRSGFPCHGVLALAGDVPPELADKPTFPFPPVLLGRGTKDTWYGEEKMARDLEVLGAKGAEVESCVFEDGHVWTDEYRAAAGQFLTAVLAAASSGD